MDFLHYVIFFILALGILIAFHEYGHYWVAKQCDVKILRFSIGFGRPIYKRVYGKDDTEFVIGSLPLGGYVKMLDEREGHVSITERIRSFNHKPVGQRIAIVAAGPLFNFIFAIAALAAIYMLGIEGIKPIVDEVKQESIASQSGLRSGDEILSINGKTTVSLTSVLEYLAQQVVSGEKTELIVMNQEANTPRRIQLALDQIHIDDISEGNILQQVGFSPMGLKYKPILGEIISGDVAEKAGLRSDDLVLSVNSEEIDSWRIFVEKVKLNPGKLLELKILRDGKVLNISLIPRSEIQQNKNQVTGKIGAGLKVDKEAIQQLYVIEHYSLPKAILKAIVKTWDLSVMTLKFLGKMITGQASVKNLSGPITIAEYAGKSADIGLIAFLSFLAMVSISVGVLNLLPIPLLDGGHLLYYLIECITGKEVSESIQIVGQQLGLTILLGLMSIAFYNDITRLIG